MNPTSTPPALPKGDRRFPLLVRLLILAAVLLLLAAALFYPVENWRGKRAWEKCKRDLVARGEEIEWDAFIPPPVPDEQNVFKAPHMTEWFVRYSTNELRKKLDPERIEYFVPSRTNPVVVAELLINGGDEFPTGKADATLQHFRADRYVFIRREPRVAHGLPKTVRAAARTNDEVIPLIVMDSVCLRDAISNLAQQAKWNVRLDPELLAQIAGTNCPEVSVRWEDVTAREGLLAIVKGFGLELIEDAKNHSARVRMKDSETVAPLPATPEHVPITDTNMIPLILMDDVPLLDAIKNLARQAGRNYVVDARIGFRLVNGQMEWAGLPGVTFAWEDISGEQALADLLDHYDLRWVPDPETGIACITAQDPLKLRMHPYPTVREQMAGLLHTALGRHLTGVRRDFLLAGGWDQIKPVRISLRSFTNEAPAAAQHVLELFPTSTYSSAPANQWRAKTVGTNSFHIGTSPFEVFPAAEYLAWSEQFTSDFAAVREALKRPHAWMDGDYQEPPIIPGPNSLTLRFVVQTLAQRMQCYLLLGQPEQAFRELSLIHEIRRILEGEPRGKPASLLASGLDVAIAGLYAEMIGEGLRTHIWREPELKALQEQLQSINLPPLLAAALRSERAGNCRMFLGSSKKSADPIDADEALPRDREGLGLFPRGWVYQNVVHIARLDQMAIESLDLTNRLVLKSKAMAFQQELEKLTAIKRPYTLFVAMVAPNFTQACQTLARNQTWADEAQVACALERYRLAHGGYPEALRALTPTFLESLPHDVMNGHPFHYRRIDDRQFLLYAVGWNETDEGGMMVGGDIPALAEGDWVWPSAN